MDQIRRRSYESEEHYASRRERVNIVRWVWPRALTAALVIGFLLVLFYSDDPLLGVLAYGAAITGALGICTGIAFLMMTDEL